VLPHSGSRYAQSVRIAIAEGCLGRLDGMHEISSSTSAGVCIYKSLEGDITWARTREVILARQIPIFHIIVGIPIIKPRSTTYQFTSGNRTAISPDCVIYRTHGNDGYWSCGVY
jgi:hypothetical protein